MPLSTSHKRMLPSDDTDANLLPSWLKAILLTGVAFPDTIDITLPLATSLNQMLPSDKPDADFFPSGLNTTNVVAGY